MKPGINWHRVRITTGLVGGYAFLAATTDALKLNPVLYLILISIAFGVSIAFLPHLKRLFTAGTPLDGEMCLALGIWLAWVSNIYRPSLALAIRLFPDLAWLLNSDWVSAGLVLTIGAGVAHLAAPAIEDGRLPSRRWAKIGCMAAIGALVGLVVIYRPEIAAMLHHPETIEIRPAALRHDASLYNRFGYASVLVSENGDRTCRSASSGRLAP